MDKKNLLIFLTFFIIILMLFVTITFFVINGNILVFDQLYLNKVRALENATLTKIMKVFSLIGSTTSVILFSSMFLLIIYKTYKVRQELYLFLVVLIGSTAINQLVKFTIKRDRPLSDLLIESGFSYPSGHTMGAVSLYGVITFLLWKHLETNTSRISLVVFSIIMILIISFSRIYLHVHYPSDVIGAILLSGMWLYITIWVYQYYMERRHRKERDHF